MSLPKDDDATLSARWNQGVLLKRDVFSTVERGRFRTDDGEVDGVLRRLDQVPFWSFAVALHLFSRERRALTLARDLDIGPKLLWAGRRALVRGFIDGAALHLAKPHGDVAYFRSAKAALRKLHRAGICHNDLAKEQNWLVGRDGRAYLTDFQLAACFKSRSRLFRLAAYEDLRHLLKHKRSYAPEALTPKERKVLAKKSAVASVWLKTGKKVYQAITRGIFNFTDREGGGRRLVNDAPVLVDLIRRNPDVRDTAIVAFADRRVGVGLYAFVEADQSALEKTLRNELTAAKGVKPPEHIQIVESAEDVGGVTVRDPEKVIWLSQTTLSVDETMQTVHALRERFPALQNPPSDDICYATQNRQVAVKAMAAQCDLVLVVGSTNSSNSVRLVEVALQAGAGASYLIDYAREIDDAWLDGVRTVGLTSGASVPEVLVRGVLDRLAEVGFDSVEEITTAEETLTFSLPRELRPSRASR